MIIFVFLDVFVMVGLCEYVYCVLWQVIFLGIYVLGMWLNECQIVEQFGVSIIFVKEVLCQLDVEGLVLIKLCSGVVVCFDYVWVEEMILVWVVIEFIIVWFVVQCILLDDIFVLYVIIQYMCDVIDKGGVEELICLNEVFYMVIWLVVWVNYLCILNDWQDVYDIGVWWVIYMDSGECQWVFDEYVVIGVVVIVKDVDVVEVVMKVYVLCVGESYFNFVFFKDKD